MSPRGFGSAFTRARSLRRSRTTNSFRRRTSASRRMPLAAETLESRAMLATFTGTGSDPLAPPPSDPVTLPRPATILAFDLDGNGSEPVFEEVANAFDNDRATKYLNRGGVNSGLEFAYAVPTRLSAFIITTANDVPDRDPTAYRIEGLSAGSWQTLHTGGLALPTARLTDSAPVTLPELPLFTQYRIVFTALRGSGHMMQVADVKLFGSQSTQPGSDPLAPLPVGSLPVSPAAAGTISNDDAPTTPAPSTPPSSDSSPLPRPTTISAFDLDGNGSEPVFEEVANAFDNDRSTKYLNRGGVNSGVEFAYAVPTRLTAFIITTANDVPDRDPTAYRIEGLSAGSWQTLHVGGLALPAARLTDSAPVTLPELPLFAQYRIVFPALRGSGHMMQIADLTLFGSQSPQPEPVPPDPPQSNTSTLPQTSTTTAFAMLGSSSSTSDITALPGYGVATSALFNFSGGGWAGWSVPDGKVVLGAKIISAGDSIDDFSVFKAAGPDDVYPHWTYGPAEYGWVMEAKQANHGVQIEVYDADPAVDLDVDSNNDGKIDPDNGPTGTDDAIENTPESAGVRLPVKGDRIQMLLATAAALRPTDSRLQINSGADNIELWDAPSGGSKLVTDALNGISWSTVQRPAAVWIQAVRPSDEVGDVRFTLSETFGTSGAAVTTKDVIRATAMAEVMLFLHFDTQTALEELEDSLPPVAEVDRAGVLRLTPADAAALETRRAAWLAHLGRPSVASTVKSYGELENSVTAAEAKLASARAAAAVLASMQQQPSQHSSQQYMTAVESALYAHDEYLHAVQISQKVQANFLADQSWISGSDEALLRRFFALPVRIDGLEADITPEQWRGLTDSFDGVRASLDRLDDNLGRAAGGLRATRDVLAGGVIAVGAVYMLPVSVAVYAGGTILASGAILSGANRWNAGQSEFEVVFGAAADTAGVTSLSLGLWGRDPVTGQEVALTPEDGTYQLVVGASSIAMLASMPFAKGLPGPTTKIRMPTVQKRAVESFSVVGDTLVASPVRVPVATWTEGAIEVSHQGVAIASAYAGTTRIVAMMASGPGPLLQGPADFDPQSLRGLTVDEVKSRIPSDWISETSSNGRGIRFIDPHNRGRQIRIDPTGYGAGVRPDPVVAGPYAVVSQNGRVIKVPLAGNPTL